MANDLNPNTIKDTKCTKCFGGKKNGKTCKYCNGTGMKTK